VSRLRGSHRVPSIPWTSAAFVDRAAADPKPGAVRMRPFRRELKLSGRE